MPAVSRAIRERAAQQALRDGHARKITPRLLLTRRHATFMESVVANGAIVDNSFSAARRRQCYGAKRRVSVYCRRQALRTAFTPRQRALQYDGALRPRPPRDAATASAAVI